MSSSSDRLGSLDECQQLSLDGSHEHGPGWYHIDCTGRDEHGNHCGASQTSWFDSESAARRTAIRSAGRMSKRTTLVVEHLPEPPMYAVLRREAWDAAAAGEAIQCGGGNVPRVPASSLVWRPEKWRREVESTRETA